MNRFILSPAQKLNRSIDKLRVTNVETREFVPEGALNTVVTKQAVRKIVKGFTKCGRIEEVTEFIVIRAKKVFSILVNIGHPEHIEGFLQNDQMQARDVDAILPLMTESLHDCIKDDYVASQFYKKQWEFCAPKFTDTMVHPRSFKPETILPYQSEATITRGGFGLVHRTSIHPSHSPEGYAEFVRKELDMNDETYDNETHVLAALQRLNHPNVLRLIACYTFRQMHHIISPYIPNGTLREFLTQPRSKNLNNGEMLCLMAGLSSAVWALHELVIDNSKASHKCLHQDLKPDNVLYDGKRLILADFGLSSIRLMAEDSKTPFKGRQGFCQAPECADLQWPYEEHSTTRKTDVFALGCIAADLIVYLVEGPDGIRRFREFREFEMSPMCYSLFHKGKTANEAVAKFLRQIADKDGTPAVKDTVQLISEMLEISAIKRPTAGEVTARLYVITLNAFVEQLKPTFAKFRHCPDAVIEEARFESWSAALDAAYYLNLTGPTTTARIFDFFIDKIRRFEIEIEAINPNDPRLDNRSFLELRQLNTELISMLPQNKKARALSCLSSILLEKIGPEEDDPIYRSFKSAFGESSLTEMADTKQMVARMNQVRGPSSDPSSDFKTISHALSQRGTLGRYTIAKVHGSPTQPGRYVLVEPVPYQDSYRREKLLPRVHALSRLLSNQKLRHQLSVPPFYALHDQAKSFSFGLLYDLSEAQGHSNTRPKPTTLRALMTQRDKAQRPSLEVRFRLALRLAESLAAFHNVDWFHKDLTSFSILFLSSQEHVSKWLEKPYLVGFQHSRSASDGFSEGPSQDKTHHRYHDPLYLSTGVGAFRDFQPQFDYYSLGIVLLEIGFWNTICSEMEEYRDMDNTMFSRLVVKDKLPGLEFTMGSKYASVVTQCLTGWNKGDLDIDRKSASAVKSNVLFNQVVVAPLRQLCSTYEPPDVPHLSNPKRSRDDSMVTVTLPVKRQKSSG